MIEKISISNLKRNLEGNSMTNIDALGLFAIETSNKLNEIIDLMNTPQTYTIGAVNPTVGHGCEHEWMASMNLEYYQMCKICGYVEIIK